MNESNAQQEPRGGDDENALGLCTLIIFGATGDLTKRLLVPALLNLHFDGKLSSNFSVVAVGRRTLTNKAFCESLETFVALKLELKNERWAGVPFYLRTGKCMQKRLSQIVLQLKPNKISFFENENGATATKSIVITVEPEKTVVLEISAMVSGAETRVKQFDMQVSLDKEGLEGNYNGYESLFYDCMLGDQVLFNRFDSLRAGWKIVEHVQKLWNAKEASDFPNYQAGSWGPKGFVDLLAQDGRTRFAV